MKTIFWTIAAVALIAACSENEDKTSNALTPDQHETVVEAVTALDAEAGRTVAQWCGDCHGEDGVSETRYIPHLAGQRMEYIIDGLKAYRDGVRDNPAMLTVATSLNDTAMKNVTAYYATRGTDSDKALAPKPNAEPKPPLLAKAPSAAKWAEKCNRCHDDSGYRDHGQFPILTGQREEYLSYALHAYQNKFLRDNSMMHAMTELMGVMDIKDIAAYYAERHGMPDVGGTLEAQVPSDVSSER